MIEILSDTDIGYVFLIICNVVDSARNLPCWTIGQNIVNGFLDRWMSPNGLANSYWCEYLVSSGFIFLFDQVSRFLDALVEQLGFSMLISRLSIN